MKNYKTNVDSFYERIKPVSEEQANLKLSEDKWSLKEIVGHLVDSASNNHQRFVRLQFDDLLGFPAYDGEKWVKAGNYNNMSWNSITSLWYNYNCLLINIIGTASENSLDNVWIKDETAIPLKELIEDYFKHMNVHMEHFENRLKEISA